LDLMAQLAEGRIVVAWLAIGALAFVALRAPFVAVPLERDEGEYAYIAWRVLEGEVPYRDAFDQKPPGVFAAYLGAFALFGRSAPAIRLFLHLWSVGTALVLFVFLRRMAGGLAAAGATLVFAVLSTDPRMGAVSANTESFLLLPMVGAMGCWTRALEGERKIWWIACGALAAAACWFKPVAATNLLLLALLAALDLPGESGSRRALALLRRAGWLAVGVLAVSAPVLAVFAAAGAGRDLVDAVFLHNLAYAQRRTPAEGLDNLRFALAQQAPSFAVFWLLAGWALLRPQLAGRRAWAVLAGWLAASLLGAAIGLQFRPHYFVQVLPALAALCGVTLAGASRRFGPGRGTLTGLVLGLVVVAVPAIANRGFLLAGSPEAVARRLWGLNPFPEAVEIGRYIGRTSAPDDSVYVVGSEPQIFFYAERRSATRYIFFYPLTGAYPDAARRQREAMSEVRSRRPLYVVWANLPTSLLASEGTEAWIFDETDAMLRESYRLEFMVHADPDGEAYAFSYGSEARRWIAEAADGLPALPWLAVYRRIP
jgi:4-amino-4-deoxy-L-arabinose transferase-like glycosyltransferase